MAVLVDTDVLIWHLRGYSQTAQSLNRLPMLMLSAMSYLELLQGMRNKEELVAVQKMFVLRNAIILPFTPSITARATELMAALALSHGLQAATALEHQMSLLTGNGKDFAPIAELHIEKFALAPA